MPHESDELEELVDEVAEGESVTAVDDPEVPR